MPPTHCWQRHHLWGPVWCQTPGQPCSLSQGLVELGGGWVGAGCAAAS